MKKIFGLAAAGVAALTLSACGSDTMKIGVLVSDATSAEALAFRNYYENYVAKQYDVEFLYSSETTSAADEKSAIESFIVNNVSAVISFSSDDRGAQIRQTNEAKVYYAVATGTLSDEEYETYKSYEYYVGSIGPSLDIEFEAGYDMAKYFIEQGEVDFGIFGGAISYYTDMHIYRAAGMIQAMIDAGGTGANYFGKTTKEGIIGQIYQDAAVKLTTVGNSNIVGYVGGYTMDEAWYGSIANMAAIEGLDVILAVGNGSDFFGATPSVQSDAVQIGSVDAYASDYQTAMKSGALDYLAGKFSASIAPTFAAVYRAAEGDPVRDENGNAYILSQGYWVATSAEEFDEYYAVDNSVESPAYTKEDIDYLIGCSYSEFADFVSKYTFEDIKA